MPLRGLAIFCTRSARSPPVIPPRYACCSEYMPKWPNNPRINLKKGCPARQNLKEKLDPIYTRHLVGALMTEKTQRRGFQCKMKPVVPPQVTPKFCQGRSLSHPLEGRARDLAEPRPDCGFSFFFSGTSPFVASSSSSWHQVDEHVPVPPPLVRRSRCFRPHLPPPIRPSAARATSRVRVCFLHRTIFVRCARPH